MTLESYKLNNIHHTLKDYKVLINSMFKFV